MRFPASREDAPQAHPRRPCAAIHELLSEPCILGAGGRNVFASRSDRYPTITPDELGASNPDVVLLSTEPFPFKPSHADEIAAASGLPPARFRIVDGELLSWHGSRTPAGIDYAEQVMLGRAWRKNLGSDFQGDFQEGQSPLKNQGL